MRSKWGIGTRIFEFCSGLRCLRTRFTPHILWPWREAINLSGLADRSRREVTALRNLSFLRDVHLQAS